MTVAPCGCQVRPADDVWRVETPNPKCPKQHREGMIIASPQWKP